MQQTICSVCKTPIDDALVIETDRGPVHPGQCLQHIQDIPVLESGEDILNETELLL
ncbi:UvsY.2 family protein [Acinetobacter baumannii]